MNAKEGWWKSISQELFSFFTRNGNTIASSCYLYKSAPINALSSSFNLHYQQSLTADVYYLTT